MTPRDELGGIAASFLSNQVPRQHGAGRPEIGIAWPERWVLKDQIKDHLYQRCIDFMSVAWPRSELQMGQCVQGG